MRNLVQKKLKLAGLDTQETRISARNSTKITEMAATAKPSEQKQLPGIDEIAKTQKELYAKSKMLSQRSIEGKLTGMENLVGQIWIKTLLKEIKLQKKLHEIREQSDNSSRRHIAGEIDFELNLCNQENAVSAAFDVRTELYELNTNDARAELRALDQRLDQRQ